MSIINSEVKTSTGCSPAELLFGDAIDLQVRVFEELNENVPINYDYFRNLVKLQKSLLKVAAETQLDSDMYHIKMRIKEDSDKNYVNLDVNDLVLWDDPAQSTPKLKYTWKGPFLILKKEVGEDHAEE